MKAAILKTKAAFQQIGFFKLFIVVSTVCFLIILSYNLSKTAQNGRYQRFDDGQVIDTRTGKVYLLHVAGSDHKTISTKE